VDPSLGTRLPASELAKKPALPDRGGRTTRHLADLFQRAETTRGRRLVSRLVALEARNLILNLQLFYLQPVYLQIVRARPGDLFFDLSFEYPMFLS